MSDHTKRNVSEALDQFFIHALKIQTKEDDGLRVLYDPDLYVKNGEKEKLEEDFQSSSTLKGVPISRSGTSTQIITTSTPSSR